MLLATLPIPGIHCREPISDDLGDFPIKYSVLCNSPMELPYQMPFPPLNACTTAPEDRLGAVLAIGSVRGISKHGLAFLLRTSLDACCAQHKEFEVPHVGESDAQFAPSDDAQDWIATVPETVRNDGRRLLLKTEPHETVLRQCSDSYVDSNHAESAKVADLCKLHET